MKSTPAFQFYPHDFLVGTADMTAEEVGGYIRLLCYQWAKGPLPSDMVKLTSLAGCTSNACASIMHKFCIDGAGAYYNARLEQVRADQEKYRSSRSENAKNGWKSRKTVAHAEHMHSTSNAHAEHMVCSSPSSSSKSGDAETEPPSGFPRSEAEAVAMCITAGVPEDQAKLFYNDAVGCGYLDIKGRKIRSFAHHCAAAKGSLADYEARQMRLNAAKFNTNQKNGATHAKPQRHPSLGPDRNDGTFNQPGRYT